MTPKGNTQHAVQHGDNAAVSHDEFTDGLDAERYTTILHGADECSWGRDTSLQVQLLSGNQQCSSRCCFLERFKRCIHILQIGANINRARGRQRDQHIFRTKNVT